MQVSRDLHKTGTSCFLTLELGLGIAVVREKRLRANARFVI